MKNWLTASIVILIALLFFRVPIIEHFRVLSNRANLPPAVDSKSVDPFIDRQADLNTKATSSSDSNSPVQNFIIPDSEFQILLQLPFTSQAPFAVWDERDEEACEEASLLMISKSRSDTLDPTKVDVGLNKIIDWEKANLGEWKSTTAEQTLRIAKEYFKLNGELIENPTEQKIKDELAKGHFVVVPAAGRDLGNPYFKRPGPIYHMLVIRGFKDGKLITNDPGTKRGQNYLYDPKTLLDANHSYDPDDIQKGERVMFAVW